MHVGKLNITTFDWQADFRAYPAFRGTHRLPMRSLVPSVAQLPKHDELSCVAAARGHVSDAPRRGAQV